MTGRKIKHLKMYFLLKMGIFHYHVSFPGVYFLLNMGIFFQPASFHRLSGIYEKKRAQVVAKAPKQETKNQGIFVKKMGNEAHGPIGSTDDCIFR